MERPKDRKGSIWKYMEREQIKKALECCTSEKGCTGCPRFPSLMGCSRQNMIDALALIKELTEENERLRSIPEQLHKEMSERMAEEVKIERKLTVRKMQERLCVRIKDKFSYHGWYLKETVIPEIAKEIIEGGDTNGDKKD